MYCFGGLCFLLTGMIIFLLPTALAYPHGFQGLPFFGYYPQFFTLLIIIAQRAFSMDYRFLARERQ